MRARGYTLLELVIALTVSLMTVAAGVTLLLASHRSFQVSADDRQMQETARVAMEELAANLRTAGYGLEPTFAFDVGPLANTEMMGLSDSRNSIPQPAVARFGGYRLAGEPLVRDRDDGPDELVFYSRDPEWERGVTAAGQNVLRLAPPMSGRATTLLAGQVLQVMCYGSSEQWLWAYVTVASVDATNPAQPTVNLEPATGQPYDFPFQNALLTQSCFGAGAASVRAFKIDRYHYYVASVDDLGNVRSWQTPGTRPYLMLDQGLSRDGVSVITPVAPDVEDLQVAYLFPLRSTEQVLGATAGQPVTADLGGNDAGVFNLNPAAAGSQFAIPSYSTPTQYIDLARTLHHPANIRAVRVAIAVRSPTANPQDQSIDGRTLPAALNRGAVIGVAGGYHRMIFESTTYTRNMEVAMPMFPTFDQSAGLAACCNGPGCTPAAGGNCGGG
jgi:type IV pilus assembly protein PilW